MPEPQIERFENVWDALEKTAFDAQRMRIKSDMMITIEKIIRSDGLVGYTKTKLQ